jgi:crotonobetainyl-CoA:carnitine CoA-transferase CaiB-like acyl-CoA transferase
MVEAVLNVAAEQVVEYGAYGNLLRRDGNRGPGAAPQGVYPCAGDDRWVAMAVENDEQWKALRAAMGDPTSMAIADLETARGRRDAHEAIPAAPVVHQPEIVDNDQLVARGFFETLDHPLIGPHRYMSMPFRYGTKTDGWLRRPPPTLGQHNDEVLGGELGLTQAEMQELRDAAVIGDRPVGA